MYGSFDGRRVRESCKTSDLARAKLYLENRKREFTEGWRENYDRTDRSWGDVASLIHERHRLSARKRGIPFDLKVGDVYALMKSTGFRCAVSGIPFAKRLASDGRRDPWAASIDRIENRHGYTSENVRVVCVIANIAMSDWGFDALIRLSRGVQRSSVCVDQESEKLTRQESNGTAQHYNPLMQQ
jgi:hypothetical protein